MARALGLPDASAEVSDADLAAVTTLACDGLRAVPVRSLAGIERLAGLTELDAPRNEIADLGLSQNPVADLTPLAGTTTPAALGVAAARVTDVEPLAGHDALRTLDLSGNAVADVAGLADAPLLQELQLGANPVTDLIPLLGIETLVNLGLDETDPARLTGVEELRAAGVSVNGLP